MTNDPILIAPDAVLTTQQAADYLGVSRPHLVKLIDQGQLPSTKVGTHRRVLGADLIAFRQSQIGADATIRFDSVESAIADFADGRLVVVVDDDDRENEGDLILAASKASPEAIAFMIRHTSGILCTPISAQRARDLGLSPMVAQNNAPLRTAFTQSVDLVDGLTTGISAIERCNTIRALANHNVGADRFVRPGHVFPLIAARGGVLSRSGHTEAGIDLAQLAGLPDVAVLAELVNDDGTVKRLPDLAGFAKAHGLKLISIADLIAYRRRSEQLVREISRAKIETDIGPAEAVVFQSLLDDGEHLAVIFGSLIGARPPLVRLHREAPLSDIFQRHRPEVQGPLSRAMARMDQEKRGLIVYLRGNDPSFKKALGFGVDQSAPKPEEPGPSEIQRESEWRDIGLGAQILRALGLHHIRLLSTQRHDYVGLAGFDLTIDEIELLGQ